MASRSSLVSSGVVPGLASILRRSSYCRDCHASTRHVVLQDLLGIRHLRISPASLNAPSLLMACDPSQLEMLPDVRLDFFKNACQLLLGECVVNIVNFPESAIFGFENL